MPDNKQAFEIFSEARFLYMQKKFRSAENLIEQYRSIIDYDKFERIDQRHSKDPEISFIIVYHNQKDHILKCLRSILDLNGDIYEVIVVDNNSSEVPSKLMGSSDVLYIRCPLNFGPSEGRNIGSHFARGRIFVFIDDDAVVDSAYITHLLNAYHNFDLIALRGRIVPNEAPSKTFVPPHWDLGPYPLPALLETEGNMSVLKDVYMNVGGMNPLMFGAEGVEFSIRCLQSHPTREIYYWPNIVIYHSFATGGALGAKKNRHAIAASYLKYKFPNLRNIARQYGYWYQNKPGPYGHKDPRTAAQRFRGFLLDMGGAFWLPKKSKTTDNQKVEFNQKESETSLLVTYHNPSPPELPLQLPTSFQSYNTLRMQEEIAKLRKEMEIIRGSFSFQFSVLVGEILSSPIYKWPTLPFKVLRLAKENRISQLIRKARKPTAADTSLAKPRAYINPGREEHRCEEFDGARPLRTKPLTPLSVAGILSEALQKCLAPEVILIPLEQSKWQEMLEEQRPSFVLVESIWSNENPEWADIVSPQSRSHAILKSLLEYCRKHSIPTIFWNTEDSIHYDFFLSIASQCDYIFASDPESAVRYEKKFGKDRCGYLPPAIQPAIHNPIRHARDRFSGRPFPILYDGWADLLEYPDEVSLIRKLLPHNLHIVESRYRYCAKKLRDLPEIKSRVLGCLNYDQMHQALKYHRIFLIFDRSLSSPMALNQKAMTAAACGAVVIWKGTSKTTPINEISDIISDEQQLNELIMTYLNDDHEWARTSHLRRRFLYQHHTYSHRIREICKKINIHFDWDPHPLATLITPTKRPEYIGRSLENYDSQIYPNKEWILIINKDMDIKEIRKQFENRQDIRVFQLHEEKNIGSCLNLATSHARGTYCFKMDDDDVYGDHYISDMMLNLRSVDADIFGKPAPFMYFEEDNTTYFRSNFTKSQHVLSEGSSVQICGATISWKRSAFEKIRFSEDLRASVDTDFIDRCINKNLKIYVMDPFNFVAMRYKNPFRHTWRGDDDRIRRNSIFFSKGKNFENILI